MTSNGQLKPDTEYKTGEHDYSYKTDGNIIKKLENQLNTLGEKLLQQKEIKKENPMLFS